jgi:putative ABC transport system permease protein
MKTQLKLALKVLARRKFFTFISLFGISMTLLVLMVATAVLDNVYSPRAPESRFDRALLLMTLGQYGEDSTMTTNPGYGFLTRYMRPLPGIEASSIYSEARQTRLYVGDRRIDTTLKRTDGSYWRICDFQFLEGRPYTQQEDDAGAHVAVITDKLREKLFAGQSAVGRTIDVEGDRFRVIGVVPRVPDTRIAAYAEIWAPIGTIRSSTYRDEFAGGFYGVVLAKSASDLPRLKRDFASVMQRVKSPDPKTFTKVEAGLDTPFEASARSLFGATKFRDRAPVVLAAILVLAGVLFMTLPALNLITLNLSRTLERASEIGVRKAFGAPRRALMSQFVFENVVITVLGGFIGFVLAAIAIQAINAMPFLPDMSLDLNLRIFGYGMLIAIFFGVFSGVYPAWRMARLSPVNALRGGAH